MSAKASLAAWAGLVNEGGLLSADSMGNVNRLGRRYIGGIAAQYGLYI